MDHVSIPITWSCDSIVPCLLGVRRRYQYGARQQGTRSRRFEAVNIMISFGLLALFSLGNRAIPTGISLWNRSSFSPEGGAAEYFIQLLPRHSLSYNSFIACLMSSHDWS